MTKDEKKKLLYRVKPDALLIKITKSGITYQSLDSEQAPPIIFLVPLSDIGDAEFKNVMPAQLLIRYLID